MAIISLSWMKNERKSHFHVSTLVGRAFPNANYIDFCPSGGDIALAIAFADIASEKRKAQGLEYVRRNAETASARLKRS